ncbi:MAG: pyrimidine-nucleoside phosphorylase [Clostridia bacterium]|nr:pyrimidine-nucleoside phosphorylase [Clostridia bacterium]
MRMYDIIKKKRDGGALTSAEIDFFIRGYVNGDIPDYQAAALCMAIWFRGMNAEETANITLAIRDSGEILHLSGVDGLRVDKHSTGGVGDKTSLVIAPVVAALGVKVAKMSGRGLGHTGGTVDKLESFAGFRTDLSVAEFERTVNETGIAIVGQSSDLAPADKLLYALRDVTATVDSIPLIASSIMGKKLAADDDCIVLDVKTGSGAFMKSVDESRKLAEAMVDIGKRAGKKMCALITDMDRPLGNTIGNSLEVIEAIETLKGNGPEDLRELCVALASHMLCLAEKGDLAACETDVRRVLASGEALQKLADMVEAQGGDRRWVYEPERFPKAAYSREVCAARSGYLTHTDAEEYGRAALLLGAGRSKKEDVIDQSAGIRLLAKTGDRVEKGMPIAILYTSKEALLDAAEEALDAATRIEDTQPTPVPLIFDTIL